MRRKDPPEAVAIPIHDRASAEEVAAAAEGVRSAAYVP